MIDKMTYKGIQHIRVCLVQVTGHKKNDRYLINLNSIHKIDNQYVVAFAIHSTTDNI